MRGCGILLVSFALIAFGSAKCPKRKTSPVREILCYTSTFDAQLLAGSVCSCTTLVHQNHDVRNLSISDIFDLRKSLKEMHPPLQFVISIHDPAMTLRNSAMVRQEAIARIIAVMKEVDGVEMNVTAGSKERLYNFVKSLKDEMIRKSYDKRIFIVLPTKPEDLAKQFDIKELIKYIDLFTLPTDYMTDKDGAFVTFHPSRLMGLFDMLNTDSLVDLISGLGAPKQKILMTLPASAYKFTLKNENENAPRSATTQKEPVPIDRKQLCEAINSGEWTVERDEDLTAPYAFQNKTWIAFEDKISVGIKGKYALLRDLAGLAVRNVENDVETECEEPLTQEIYHSFVEFRRKSRQAVLNELEDELHQMQFSYPNHAKTSSFRVVRVVDTEGHIKAVRENTQTEFICRRQGYFVHPKSCNRFYRCVKFNQAIEDYSVFEFDCPAGLSFDERTEVCVWPGSLPEGSPCPGSSEIAPVAPKRFECSQPGYYADPQNCRWFFACMDLGEPELMAFEFRCPYGLVFDEKKLVCEWPWLVPACSESGSGYTRTEYNYGGFTAGASPSVGVGDYVTSGLPEYSVTAGTDYSNVDYSRTTSGYNTNIHGGYFGSTAGSIGKHPSISTSGVETVSGHVGLSSPAGTDYSKSTGYGGAVSSIPTYSGIQIGSVPPSTIGGEGGTGYLASSSKIGGTGYTVSTDQSGTGYSVSTGHDGTGYSVSTGGFNTGFANTELLRGVSAGFSGSSSKIGGTGYTVSTGQDGTRHSVSTGHDGTGYSVSTGGFNTGFANTGSLKGVTADFSGSSSKIGGTVSTGQDDTRHSVSTGQDNTGYSVSTGGFNTGFANTGSLGGVTAGFSGSTSGEYSGTTSGSHLTEQDITYTGRLTSSYPSSVAGGYKGGISTSNPIIDTSHSRIPGASYFGSTGFSVSPIDIHIGSTSPKYVESTNVYAGSSTSNTDGYSASIGVYSGATGRQPSFGETGPSFGSVSYPGATGNIEITGSTNKEYTGSTAYGGLSGAGYSKVTGGISAGSTEGNIHLSTSSGIGSNLQSATGSSRIPGTNFISGAPKFGLGTSGISTDSGHVSVTSRPTGTSSTGYKYDSEEGYTIPVFIQHEEPNYPSFETTGAGVRGHAGTTATNGISLTGSYGKINFARPNLNISIFGNEIPINYDVQKGITGTIQTGSSVDESIITGDSFSGTVFSHGNVPGALSTPAINQGSFLTGGVRPGYVATSSGTSGYTISDGVKTTVESASPGTLLYGTPSPAFSASGPSTAGVTLKSDSTLGVVVSGQTAPGVSVGGSIHPSSTIESSIPKSYVSQSTYHGISGAPARGSIAYSSSTPSEGLISTIPHSRTDEGHGTVTFNAAYDISKYTENDIPDYRPTSSILPDSIVSGGKIEGTGSSIFGSTFGGSTTVAPKYSSSKPAVFTSNGFTKTGPTRTGITTAILGGSGSYSISTSDRRPTYSPDNISEKAFEENITGYTKTSSTDGLSVTLTPSGYSSTAAPGSRITVQSATSGYSYPKPNVQFGTSGAAFSARTDEGHGIVNVAYDINKYTENDIPDYRPTSSILPDSIVSGGRIEDTGSGIFGSTFGGSTTVTPKYSSSKPAVFTPSGFTKIGPTRTGITTAILGGGGSYSISTSERRPTYSPDNISEKAFEGNITGYTKTSSTDGLSVTLPPPGYSSTAAPGSRITVQSATSGYSYPKPNVQFGTSGVAFSATPIAPIGSTPFFARLPTSTITPVIYTTEQPEIYKTTLFESKKVSAGVSTTKPVIDTGYKTVISPTIIPVVSDDRFIQQTGDSKIPSVSTSSLDLEMTFQRTDSSGPTGYSSSLGYLPAKSTKTGAISSTTQYDVPTVTARPEFIGVTYKKPSPDVTYGGPSSFQSPTTFRPSNVYYSGQGFSTTPSSLGTTSSGGSPTNLDISRDKIDKLITNYDRGTIKYTPSVYDTYASSGFDSTSTQKFTSSLSSTKSSFSAKTDSGFAITTPFGVRPTTFSYEVTTKSSEGKGKVIVKWSDLHPLLLGKLGAECTCKADPFANLRGPGKKLIESSKGKVDLANYDDSEIYVDLEDGSSEEGDYSSSYNFPQPFKISPPETTTSTNLPSSSYLSAINTRTSGRSNEFRSSRRMGKKLKYEEEEEEEKDDYYDDDPDQIINGVTDCARPGLFRHPGLCNKFYACHWDQWKKKFTLHIFNCPVHLTFDSNAGACNWPSKGPACQADNLLV